MRVFSDTQPNSRRGFRVPAGVNLRECSVIIVGSTCKICGRDFKCESDVALHKRWRHLAIESLIGSIENELCVKNASQKCDVCDMYLETVSDLRIHKRQAHGHRKRRRGTVRVRFKLDGVTMTDVTLDRKYLRMLRYLVDVSTQTESLEKEKRQDNCATNIDLPLLPGNAGDNAVQCDIRPHKVANRYIVGKFTSTAHSTVMVGRSLAEISNTSHRDAISGSNGSYVVEKEDPCDIVSREDRTDTLIVSLVDNVNIQDKENSRTINTRERRNVYCQSEISILEDFQTSLACQQDKSNDTTPYVSKQNSNESNENLCCTSAKRPKTNEMNDSAKSKLSTGLTNSFGDVVDICANENNIDNSFDGVGVTMKRSSAPFRLNDETESAKTNANVDDDVQEVLRIKRGNVQNDDINHESPNRTEREILVQNAIKEMRVFSTHRSGSSVCMEKRSAELMANDVNSSDYSSFASIAEGSYQLLADALNKKLSSCIMKDLHHYGISYYNDLPEINNNLEEYAMYAHEGFLVEPWMQAASSQYVSELKTNDIEATVNLE